MRNNPSAGDCGRYRDLRGRVVDRAFQGGRRERIPCLCELRERLLANFWEGNFRRILCPVKASNRANMKSCFNKGEIFGGELIAANIDTRSELGFPAEKRW